MVENIFCPTHMEVQQKITEVQQVQKGRPCQENTEKLKNIEKTTDRFEEIFEKQWTAINQLRRLIYIGVGGTFVLAFLGSIIGSFLKK